MALAKNNPQQTEPMSSNKSVLRKWIERSMMLTATVGTITVIMMYGDLLMRYINPPMEKSKVYGTWVEQDVAHYARQEFVLSAQGVSVDGSIVATEFDFDGRSLSFTMGAKQRRFEFIDPQHTQIKQDGSGHYLPIFHLQGYGNYGERG